MTTSEIVRDRALELARSGMPLDEAVTELTEACGGRRVAAVRARQELAAMLDRNEASEAQASIELLDEVLVRLPV
jgi:hypothetical protein